MSIDLSQPFSALLRGIRLSSDLTQEALAERAGLSTRAVSDLERGTRQFPHRETAEMLADGLALQGETRTAFLEVARRRKAGSPSTPGLGLVPRVVDLPAPPTAILGRDAEIAEAITAISVSRVRLLTMTGPGGVGKTRLSVEVAGRLADRYARVHFVSLAALEDARLVLPRIGRALDVQADGDSAQAAQLREVLQAGPTLLVLDNLEHLLAAQADIAHLLADCPLLTILATSRIPLRVRGEREFPVRPLATTRAHERGPSANQLPAIALFLERAQAIAPAFSAGADDEATLIRICQRLDGLPLAIELAAARIKILSLASMLARLEDNLELLTRGATDAPPRQQTMHATIGWSYDLLPSPEQALFRRIAVLADAFDLEAAAAVASPGDEPRGDALVGLEALVDKSLVVRLTWEGVPRFGMLTTVRQFALVQLRAAAEEDAARHVHCTHFLARLESITAAQVDGNASPGLERIEAEYENVRAALRWSLQHDDWATALRFTGALAKFWYLQGLWTEGRSWLDQVLANAADAPTPELGRSLLGLGAIEDAQGDLQAARRHYDQALVVFQQLEHSAGMCRALNNLGNLQSGLSEFPGALSYYEDALATCREAGDTQGMAQAILNIGIVEALRGKPDVALPLLRESLSLARKTNDQFGIGTALVNLASLSFRQGELDRAQAYSDEAMAVTRASGDAQGAAATLLVQGDVALQLGTYHQAEARFEDALTCCRELGDLQGEAAAQAGLGAVAGRGDRDAVRALHHIEHAVANFARLEEQEQLAWCLDELAYLRQNQGESEAAAGLLGAADGLLRQIDCPRAPVYERDRDALVAAVRLALGSQAYLAAWELGMSKPEAQVAALTGGSPDF